MIIAAVAAATITVDQLAKTWASRALVDKDIHVFGPLQFSLTHNSGVAFGLADGIAPFVVPVVVAFLIWSMAGGRLSTTKVSIVAVGLVLGGALGNVADRLFRDTGGAVVDFIDLYVGDSHWPTFNIADASIVTGAILMVVFGNSSREAKSTKSTESNEKT